MKLHYLVMMLVGLILLIGCSKTAAPSTAPTPSSVVQQAATTSDSTAASATSTSQPQPTKTAVPPTDTSQPPPTETVVAPANTSQPQATQTAISSTNTPQPEPTHTPEPAAASTPKPSATAILCGGDLTSANQEGPFYSEGSPERSSLIDDDMPGVPTLIVGRVFDQDCNPIAGAKLDFWLADVDGEYDNVGYTLRGHLFSDENGNYALESIEPTSYTGRPPHIHVKVFAPDGLELLTTQMYFAGSEGSADVITSPDLLVSYLEADENGRQQVLFNFVVRNR